MSEYKDYNWNSGEFTNAHYYFMEPIIKMLTNESSPILDVGCGNGAFANHLISLGFEVYGTDASVSGIEIANKKNPGHFFVHDLLKDELPKELEEIKYRTIISTEVIEHLYSPRSYIQLCKKVLKKSNGGYLILTTPYNGYLKNLIISMANKWDTHLNPLWDGGHIKFWSRSTLTKLLKEFDFEVLEFKGCGRVALLWKSMIIKSELKV